MYQFTSESVSEGHPDKVADKISDVVASLYLNGKNHNRAAIETLVTTNLVVLAGEYKSDETVTDQDIENHVKQVIREIGYDHDPGFNWRDVTIINKLHGQSADIALGTDDFGAGDQGLMFGYAVQDTPVLMPAPIYYCHSMLKKLASLRKLGAQYQDLRPDSKAQITMNYGNDGRPINIDKLVCSTQHTANVSQDYIKELVMEAVESTIPEELRDRTQYLINPTGKFVIGGPDGDTGLTGRKIIVDTYGGAAPHGGGAFSGKDGSKVDRTGAYMARYLARNLVYHHNFYDCLVQLSYAIGVKEPTSVTVWTDGKINERMGVWIQNNVDLTPLGMIELLEVNSNFHMINSSQYGHFGDTDMAWEKNSLW